MSRYRFLIMRPIQMIPVLFGISLITFMLIRAIPGDPARVLLGTRSTPEAIARIHAEYGLDQPLVIQYVLFLKHLAAGELGKSIIYKTETLKVILSRFEPTLLFVLGSVFLAIVISVPLASVAARKPGGLADHLIRVFSTMGLGLPPFWLGIMLIILLSITWHLFPVSGYGATYADRFYHLFIPCLTAALSLSAVLIRSLRAAMMRELQSGYVTAACARGQSEGRIFWRHVLPNSIVPVINLLAVNISWLIGGSVVIESVFGVPGLGQLLIKAIFSRDYMVVQGVVLFFALATVVVNLLADLLSVFIDPRIKL
ncbi:ABC transporter permease [Gynuella sunshinyii]|uniref:ABC-type dipeptide/oligopeptide/nickel transport system, permease component n=1 Tax=Gynuella sunshinyii YC6258 TaxID=1445510 RepID=A0A0C5W1C9_9GAMM|nr:ABC transporter permease [Gynuella sunshinyii]AJQ96489.1 ABC-type dipeptide/oligopeptide/nickel transport system, permease component [Gynuella sunshinyii YC6258]